MAMLFRHEQVKIEAVLDSIREHANSLSFPWDSYIEENLFKNEPYALYCADTPVGYASVAERRLFSFYVSRPYYKLAPEILAYIVQELRIETAQVLTNDPLFAGLLMEWDTRLEERVACFFTDAGKREKPPLLAENPVFREAKAADSAEILLHTGDFFDRLEERIAQRTIFMLEDGGHLLGCGITEVGIIHTDCVSIGMITCREHRKKGVAQTILWHLKEWAYAHGLRPIAGCWYYNLLSRKSMEASGMIPPGKGFAVVLEGKHLLPLRTGNPPGELV
jgi:GNAT superfamily N-acetyltransferase